MDIDGIFVAVALAKICRAVPKVDIAVLSAACCLVLSGRATAIVG